MNIIGSLFIWGVYIISLFYSVFWLINFLYFEDYMKKYENKKNYSKKPFLSIIIPAYNEEKVIKKTILSVYDSDYPKDKYEVIVVDDGSSDNTLEVVNQIKKDYPSLKIIKQKNSGKATALNKALKVLKGEFFFCLDADSRVGKETMKKMVGYYYQNENKFKNKLAIVTPSMRVDYPKTLLQKFQRVEYLLAAFIQRIMGHIDCIYVAPGPFSMYRTEIIRKHGGFDVGNLTEDQEIAYRMQEHHYAIRQCPDAKVYTIAPKNVRGLFKQRNRWFKGSLYNVLKYKRLMFNKKYGDFGLFQVPLNLLNYLLSLFALGLFSFFIIVPLFNYIYNLYLVNFDIMLLIKNANLSFNILNFDYGKMFVFYTLFFLTIMLFYLSHKYTEEKILKHGFWYLIPYFFIYYLILSIVAIVVLVEFTFGKKQKW